MHLPQAAGRRWSGHAWLRSRAARALGSARWLLVALLFVPLSVSANIGGRAGSIPVRCVDAGCHDASGGYDYTVTVSVPMTRLDTVKAQPLTVTVTVSNNDANAPAQGFGWDFMVSGGTLAALPGDTSQRGAGPFELVHSTRWEPPNADLVQLQAIWTVPAISGDYQFLYCVMPVNGNGANTGDGPARCTGPAGAAPTTVTVLGLPPAPGRHFIVWRNSAARRLPLVLRVPGSTYSLSLDMSPMGGQLTATCSAAANAGGAGGAASAGADEGGCPGTGADDARCYAPCYMPSAGYVGADEFVYRVEAAGGRVSTGRVTINVTDPPPGPVSGGAGWVFVALSLAAALAGGLGRRRAARPRG